MDNGQLAILVNLALATLIQIFKGQISAAQGENIRKGALILGALSTGLATAWAGDSSASQLAINTALGALLPAGIHSNLFQNSTIGKVLSGIGAAVFKPTTP